MAIVLAILPAAGHDQLWFLLMAQRWLHGGVLYGPEAFDSNTPAIVWLSAIPVALAEWLHVSVPWSAKLMMALLEAAVAVLCRTVLRGLLGRGGAALRWYFAFVFVTLFSVVPARDFGQRDLMGALLCLPYILVAAGPIAPVRMRTMTAVLAAVGVCVKPQLALMPLGIELAAFFLVRKRTAEETNQKSGDGEYPGSRFRFRFEMLLLPALGALFVWAIRRFAPLYFSSALPTTLHTYWAIGHLTFCQLVAESVQLHVLLLIVALLAPLAWRARGELAGVIRPVLLMLMVAGLAGVVAYYQQGTGWYYQQLPGITLLGAALSLELLVLADPKTFVIPRWLPGATAGLCFLAVGLTLHFSGYPLTEERAYAITTPDPSFFVGLAPGTAVATLTTSVDDAIEPVFRYRLTWAQRMDNLWTLPAILRFQEPGGTITPPRRMNAEVVAQLALQQRRWMVEDLERWKPQLILVARCQSPEVHCQEMEDRNDDLLGFFLVDPAFRAIWQYYKPLRSVGGYDGYVRLAP
ncbi:MAG TPA: hypothetical protein VGU46_01950 [Acidobacteriaceae bacterium]|nr:hypothetical protein [Acidobacteriaceae bacterium]